MIDIFKGYKGAAVDILKKHNIRVWGDVEVKTTRGDFSGIVLPRSENDDDKQSHRRCRGLGGSRCSGRRRDRVQQAEAR